jgi:hypothetical protein
MPVLPVVIVLLKIGFEVFKPEIVAMARNRLMKVKNWWNARRVARPALPNGFREIRQSGACVQPRIAQNPRTASFWERLGVSTFLWRFPVLYGSFLELRNCAHRIQSLRKQGDILPAEIGLVYQRSQAPAYLVRNRRSQGRSLGIRKLLSDSPWMTTEDCRLFLAGWDTAEEWRERSDTEDSSEYRRA